MGGGGERASRGSLVFEFGAEDVEHVVDGFFLEIGFFDDHVAGGVEHGFGSYESLSLERFDHPFFYFVLERAQLDFFFSEGIVVVAVHVDGVAREH